MLSELYFPVVERDNAWIDKHGNVHRIGQHKSLIANVNGKSRWLANVGKDYKLVLNSELFPYIEKSVTSVMHPEQTHGMRVQDKMSYGGRDCYREFVFPNMKCDMRGGDVAFRLIVGNSYGAKAVTLMCGAIDFWCSNGMVFGVYEKTARKHTSGLTLNGLDQWIRQAQATFVTNSARLQKMTEMPITLSAYKQIEALLSDEALLSARHATQIMESTKQEAIKREGSWLQSNAWHLYSALTDWASHGDVRDTGNDHEVNTRYERSRHVERVMHVVEKHLEHAA